jgi:hypothetical protein
LAFLTAPFSFKPFFNTWLAFSSPPHSWKDFMQVHPPIFLILFIFRLFCFNVPYQLT